jgi:hypothetical protein
MAPLKQSPKRGFRAEVGAIAATASVIFAFLAVAAGSNSVALAQSVDSERALKPEAHVKIARPGRLDKDDANVIYDTIADHMAARLAISGEPVASQYRGWWRANDAPYLSATHGNRYVNNYANKIAVKAGYQDPSPGMRMPPGAVLAKDSFTFTDDRALFIGALFVMEKLAEGKSPATADWRYLMILPDGSVFADSTGDFLEAATFCHNCHKQAEEFDYLFFLPAEYRKRDPGG